METSFNVVIKQLFMTITTSKFNYRLKIKAPPPPI